MIGKIVKQLSNDYTIKADKLYICKPRGKFRNLHVTPLVGDNVEFDPVNNYILNILDRKNELERPSISNVDQAVIVTSVKIPDFSFLYGGLVTIASILLILNNLSIFFIFSLIISMLSSKSFNRLFFSSVFIS